MVQVSFCWLRPIVVTAMSFAVVVAGCSDDDGSQDPSSATSEPAPAPTAPRESSATSEGIDSPSTSAVSEWTPIDASAGRWLVFGSARTGVNEIFVVDVDTGDEFQVSDLGEAFQPAWSPDRSSIAFQCERPGGEGDGGGISPSDICVVTLDTGTVRRLTDDDAADFAPAWSPDGTRIAFHTATETGSTLRVVAAAGTAGAEDLTSGFGAVWAPDGSLIALAAEGGGIAVVDPRTDERRELSDVGSGSPAWSPDGMRLAFSCPTEGEPSPEAAFAAEDLCVLTMVDGAVHRLTTDASTVDSSPAWSPDGARIAFESSSTVIEGFGNRATELRIVRVNDGGDPETLVGPSGTWGSPSPAWDPDGSTLAVIGVEGGVVLVDPTTGAEELVVPDRTAREFRWAPEP